MRMHADYVTTMHTQLKKWDADVDALAAQGEKASAAGGAAYNEQIKVLRANRDSAQKTFQKIQVASEAAGAQMQAGMEVAWKTMQTALEKVSSDLRKQAAKAGECRGRFSASDPADLSRFYHWQGSSNMRPTDHSIK